jgi:gamma-glutamylputrescine oxidase
MTASAASSVTRFAPARAFAATTHRHATALRRFDSTEPANGEIVCDVVVIGAGFTGASAALRLAQAGRDVVLLDALEVGRGASSRNGGLVCPGYRHGQDWFEDRMGRDAAHRLWALSEDAKVFLDGLIADHEITCDRTYGLITAAHTPAMAKAIRAEADHMESAYGYGSLTRLDAAETAHKIGTEVYLAGVYDAGGGTVHPLKLLYGIAGAAVRAGVRLHEGSRVLSLTEGAGKAVARTATATIRADMAILACDGAMDGVHPEVEARVLPIGSFMLATAPLDPALGVLPDGDGAMDTRFVVNYFCKGSDGSLLFGGGEKYTPDCPADIAGFVRRNLLRVFPKLADAPITHAWTGALGITPTRLPFVRRLSPHVTVAAGYSGQGVLLAPYCGALLADAVIGASDGFDLLATLPVPAFPGGRMLRWPLLTAAMSWYALRDRIG